MKKMLSCEDRLKNMMIIDKSEVPLKMEKVVKAEICYVLKNYFEINNEDVELKIEINETGKYILKLSCQSRAIKASKCI